MDKGVSKRTNINLYFLIFILLLISVISILLAVGMGTVQISPGLTARIILSRIPWTRNLVQKDWSMVEENIIMGLRIPRVLLGSIVGASLAVCGVSMQALVRNTLADPFILGVSNGAAVFATLGMLFHAFQFLGSYAISISAFIGSIITILIVYYISKVKGRTNITQLLLSGVVISMIMDGFTSIIKLSAPNSLGLHNAEFWMSGSLAGAKWAYLKLPFLVLIICIFLLFINYRNLNSLLLGEENASAIGVNVKRIQKLLILVSSLIAGVTIAVSGTIGFIGLMVPHFTRMLVGGDHRKVLPVSALLGGILVVWVDVAARLLIAPEELPVGILTAIIGGPFFIWMMKRNMT